MASLDILIDSLNAAQAELDITPETRKLIIEKYEKFINEAKAERSLEKQKRGKKQYVVALKGPPELTEEIVAAVFVIGENDDPAQLIDKVRSAVVDNNLVARKPKNKITTIDGAISFLKPKFLKQHGVKKLSKDWERVVVIKDETLVKEN